MRTRTYLGLMVAALAVATLNGCKGKEAPSGPASTQPAAKPVEQTAERGPVKVTVRLDKDRTSIAEPVELSIEAKAEPGVEVRLPNFGEPTQGLSIRDFRDQSPKRDAPDRVWKRTYRLESFVSGEVELPPVKVEFTDSRKKDAATTQSAIESSVQVEPLKLKVESLLSGQFDPQKFNDIKAAVALPRPRSLRILMWGGIAVAALLAAGAIVWYLRRRSEMKRQVQMPPHQWAMMELERLVAEDLVSKGKVVEFYYRLNGLLRRYIELRFGLNAAEQTSEEFLRELRGDARLPVEYKPALQQFINACDPVKYARYQPQRDEIEQVFNAARDFILGTAEREREVEIEETQAVAA